MTPVAPATKIRTAHSLDRPRRHVGRRGNLGPTLNFAEHYNGTAWSVVPAPNLGPNFDSFYGLTATHGEAWAVGERLDGEYQDRALVEVWNGTTWAIPSIPQAGSVLTSDMTGPAAHQANISVSPVRPPSP